MKEEDVYLKALSVLDDALDGKTVNPVAVSAANGMFVMLWASVHQERLRREEIKQKLREEFPDEITEKEGKTND